MCNGINVSTEPKQLKRVSRQTGGNPEVYHLVKNLPEVILQGLRNTATGVSIQQIEIGMCQCTSWGASQRLRLAVLEEKAPLWHRNDLLLTEFLN